MGDQELLELLRSRDDRGLQALQSRYGPLLRYIIAPILSDDREREECYSDVCWRAWDKIDLYQEDKGSLKNWLTALARNAALNRARHTAQESEHPCPETLADPQPAPEEALLHREQLEQLRTAMATLPQLDRLLLLRKYYYRQSTAQIAAELGMSERAVEGRLYRLKQKLRSQLGGEGHE